MDTVTESYIIENIYIHDYEFYSDCINCCTYEGGTNIHSTNPVLPTPTNTPTPTSTPTNTPTNTRYLQQLHQQIPQLQQILQRVHQQILQQVHQRQLRKLVVLNLNYMEEPPEGHLV